jgi:hypothetical protein
MSHWEVPDPPPKRVSPVDVLLDEFKKPVIDGCVVETEDTPG